MVECIGVGFKDVLLSMIRGDAPKPAIEGLVQFMPLCDDVRVARPPSEAAERAKRRMAELWGIKPIYVDETGKPTEFSSPSALAGHLGLPMSGTQCDAEGKSCRAVSVVEIFRSHGYNVTGNGEPRKAAAGGTKMTVYHPKAQEALKKK